MLALILAAALTSSEERVFPAESLKQMRIELEHKSEPAPVSVRGPLVTAIVGLALTVSGMCFIATGGSDTKLVLGGGMGFAGAGIHLSAFVWLMGLFGTALPQTEYVF